MSMLIFVVFVEVMLTTDCAPNFNKLNDVLRYTQNINTTNLYNKIKYINNINSSSDNVEENIVLQNVIPDKEDKIEFENQVKTTESNKHLNSSIELSNTQTDNKTIEPNTEALISDILSKENDISDDDSSSDWLDPEFETTKRSKNKQTVPKKKECNKCAIVDQLSNENDKNPEFKQILNASSEKGLTPNDSVRTSTTKREMPHPFLIKLLRAVDNSKEIEIINIDGYDYNINICRYRGDRYLCGYNKNTGNVKNSLEIEDIGGGCIIRGDRMECGYNIRPGQVEGKLDMSSKLLTGATRTDYHSKIQLKEQSVDQNGVSSGVKPNILVSTTPLPNRRIKQKIQKACYEQDERVICYDIPG